MLKGFKDFLIRGNVIDLAVGLIMGTAFTAVVTSLVQAVLMPAISMLIGSPNFDDFLVFGQVKIGVFLTAVVNFVLIAAAVYFAVVIPVQKLTEIALAKQKAEDEAVEKEETELDLLKEIRDALAKKQFALLSTTKFQTPVSPVDAGVFRTLFPLHPLKIMQKGWESVTFPTLSQSSAREEYV